MKTAVDQAKTSTDLIAVVERGLAITDRF